MLLFPQILCQIRLAGSDFAFRMQELASYSIEAEFFLPKISTLFCLIQISAELGVQFVIFMGKLTLFPIAAITCKRKVLAPLSLILDVRRTVTQALFASIRAISLSGKDIVVAALVKVFICVLLDHLFEAYLFFNFLMMKNGKWKYLLLPQYLSSYDKNNSSFLHGIYYKHLFIRNEKYKFL